MSNDTNYFQTETHSLAIALLTAKPILGNRYFLTLAAGSMAKEEFVHSQLQFSYAVGFFSRHLAALIARLPTSAGRAVLVHNLAEEHGLDEEHPAAGFRPQFAHDKTFAQFLSTLGASPEVLAENAPEAPVRAFNLALFATCSSESPAFALAALGMIEYAFADISALIGQSVVEQSWVKAEELVHYSLHAEIDKRHAGELFEAAEGALAIGESNSSITSGLEFGRYCFDRLYCDFNPQGK
jgi:pyrroloquinoline-quinone synthase